MGDFERSRIRCDDQSAFLNIFDCLFWSNENGFEIFKLGEFLVMIVARFISKI